MQKWEEAERDYTSGMKYKEIAAKYGVTVSAVKSWKARKWSKEKIATKSKSQVATNTKKLQPIASEPLDALSPEKELFAQLVAGRKLPLYRAYQIAFEKNKPAVNTAMSSGSRLAKEKDVAIRIHTISRETAKQYEWSLAKVIEDLTFLRDESKSDVITNGLKKSNSDALLGAIEQISELLDLKGVRENAARKSKAEADIAEFKAKELMHLDDDSETTTIVDDMEAISDE